MTALKCLLIVSMCVAPSTIAQPKPDTLVAMPPAWAFGVIYGGYTNQQESDATVERLINEGYPIDAYWIDSWFWDYQKKGKGSRGYIDFVGDTVAFPNIELLWKKFESQRIKAGVWIWNAIIRDGNERVFEEFERRGFFKQVFLNRDKWHNQSGSATTGDVDFQNPAAAAFWTEKLKPFFDKGLDFLKLDRAADLPYLKTAFEATQTLGKETGGRGFILSHIHDLSNENFKRYPTKWTGDAKIAWTQPDYPDLRIYAMGAYKENVEMLANPKKAHYRVPFLAHDAGGYDFFGSTDTTDSWDELYMRWIQFAAFSPIMTVFSTANNPRKNLPFNFSKEAQENFKTYATLRQRLFPYRYSSALAARLYGEKMIQGDSTMPHQYLFGKFLLVAPVVEKGASSRSVALPKGTWIDYWTDKSYNGNRTITVDAPLSQLPLFVKAGAIIPTRNAARGIELGSNDTLTLDVYPNQTSSFMLLEDDGTSNDYLADGVGKTPIICDQSRKRLTIEPMKGVYKGKPLARTMVIRLHGMRGIRRVMLNGKPMGAVAQDANAVRLTVQLSTSERNTIVWR